MYWTSIFDQQESIVEKIVFTDDLKLGVELIDQQHERLVDLINNLIEVGPDEGDRKMVGETLDELSDYIFKHFKEEETIMQQVEYPGLEEHRKLHKEFVKVTMDFNKRFRMKEEGLGVEMLLFLSSWLIDHIKGEDPNYLKAFKDAGY